MGHNVRIRLQIKLNVLDEKKKKVNFAIISERNAQKDAKVTVINLPEFVLFLIPTEL